MLSVLFLLPSGSYGATSSLQIKASGKAVRTLQEKLVFLKYLESDKATGYFGALTETALKKFQCDEKIICSGTRSSGYGVYGPKTQATLTMKTRPLEISGWIPYWRKASGTADVIPNLQKLTSVMPFGYSLKSDGTLADTAKLTEEPWISFVAEAKKNKVLVVPSVMSGSGDLIHEILSDKTKRIALEDEITKIVKDNGFDGIDIDFEAKHSKTIDYFSTFLKGLDMRMGKKVIYCTIEARMPLDHRFSLGAKLPEGATDYANDYKELNKYCDRVEIMAYDQGRVDVLLNSNQPHPYAPVSDVRWVEALVSMAVKDISKNKIIIGIPTYGYEYKVALTGTSTYSYQLQWPFNLKYATDIATKLGITPTRTGSNEIGFTYNPALLNDVAPTGTDFTLIHTSTSVEIISSSIEPNPIVIQIFNYLSWSDAQAVADKVALARKLGVKGVAVFKFDGGEDQQIWDVLR